MGDELAELLDVLDLDRVEDDYFQGRSPDPRSQRVFGGQVLAQALVAAGRTLLDGPQPNVHSFHAYFLRPGDPRVPILYEVDRSRDGRSFTSRRVVAIQHGHQIFHMSASFQADQPGLEHEVPMPQVTPPEELPSWIELLRPYLPKITWLDEGSPLDLRYVDPMLLTTGEPADARWRVWFRTVGALPDDRLLHAALAAYAADMILLDTTIRPHGIGWFDERVVAATLDHAMWFHHDFRADDWLLYDLDSPSTSGSRGLAVGGMYTRAGRRAASMAQEGLVRYVENTGR